MLGDLKFKTNNCNEFVFSYNGTKITTSWSTEYDKWEAMLTALKNGSKFCWHMFDADIGVTFSLGKDIVIIKLFSTDYIVDMKMPRIKAVNALIHACRTAIFHKNTKDEKSD